MSFFLIDELQDMEPYVPGEQLKDKPYIKLNANESSYTASPKIAEALSKTDVQNVNYYADPNCTELRSVIAKRYGVTPEEVFVGNGADEVLGFCFMSFFRSDMKICFPDITYDFYRTYAKSHRLDMLQIPVKENFEIDVEDYIRHANRDVVIANPNNPTGLRISVSDIERIVVVNPQRLVIIDEAYVDYGNESCISLTQKYPNIIVVQTFSKSRNMAGMHIGYAISTKEIINDMNRLKFTFNPFNMNSLTLTAGIAAIEDEAYTKRCIDTTIEIREYTKKRFEDMGFSALNTHTNFIMVTHPEISAPYLNEYLKQHGVLVRYSSSERIRDYLRITIGTKEQMDTVISLVQQALDTQEQRAIS